MEAEMEASRAMGGTEGIYWDGDIARELKRIDQGLVHKVSDFATRWWWVWAKKGGL